MRALIRFGKQPRLRFISHLDMQRFFQRALNRTGLPIAYTQGFNPHPVMSFGSALALGWTSEYEILDIKLAVPMGRRRTEEAMRAALPEDLTVLEVKLVDDRHPAPMSQVRMADYRVLIEGEDIGAILAKVPEFMACETVLGMKKTKSGEKEINIRPLVISIDPIEGGFNTRVMLTEKDSLKPNLLIKALAEMAGVEVPEAKIHRVLLLGEDQNGELKPLMEL